MMTALIVGLMMSMLATDPGQDGDLLLVHKTAHVISIKEASIESAIWRSTLAASVVNSGSRRTSSSR